MKREGRPALGASWEESILACLGEGCRRFGELEWTLERISPSTLSDRLKQLEQAGLITRHAYREWPRRVEYQLTAQGWETLSALRASGLLTERTSPANASHPATNEEIRTLLSSWLEGDVQEHRETWELLKRALDEDRPSDRKLFP